MISRGAFRRRCVHLLAAGALLGLVAGCSAAPTAAPTSAGSAVAVPSAAPATGPSPAVSPLAQPSVSAAPSPAASPSVAASSAAVPAGQVHVRTAFSTLTASDAALWVASASGIFAQHGLDVDIQLIQNPNTTAALLAGDIDVAFEGASDMLGPVASGSDLVAIATLNPSYPYLFEVSSSIQSPADLKGRTLGVSQPGGSDYVALQSVLNKLGIDPSSDVNLVFVGGLTQRTAALINGAVEGTLSSPPETITIEAHGFHPLIDITSLNIPTSNAGVVVQRSYLQAHPDIVQKLIDSLVEALRFEKQNRAQTEQIMDQYLQLGDQQALDATYDFYVGKLSPSLPTVSTDQFADAVSVLAAKDPRINDVDLNRVVDNSFVLQAARDVPGAAT